jgi:hypothetical protein
MSTVRGRPACLVAAALRRCQLLALDPTVKGGISAMAKKTAKGGKKKGGKKR